jgi:peptidoglycan/LPS O-acetylase OafA/YrhL
VVATLKPHPRTAAPRRTAAKPDYFPALTGLRFVLALWVILHHISGPGMMLDEMAGSLPPAAATLLRGGYLAVQTFFILSGFVLARTYAKTVWNAAELRNYAWARIARIYPVYAASLAIVAPFMYEAMLKPGRTAAQKSVLLADYAFVLQGWTGSLGVGWNTPAWSLSCEFFFYLAFPLLLPAIRRARGYAVAGVSVLCLVAPVLLAHSNVPWEWKPVHHLGDFAAGIAAARVFDILKPRMRRVGHWLYLPAIGAGVLLILHPSAMNGTYGDLNTGLRPLNAVALLGFALSGGSLAAVLSTRAAEYLGKISYSMYILHVPILWWYSHWAMYGPLHMPRLLAVAVYLALVTGVSAAAFALIEMPANRWIRKRFCARVKQHAMPVRAAA